MIQLNSQFFFIILNILILYLILRKFLFRPVTEYMENRANHIRKEIDEAKSARKNAEDLLKDYQKKLRSAHEKADEILHTMRERANHEYESIIAQARQDAEQMIYHARRSIEQERQEMVREMRNEITNLAFSVASKIMQNNMNTEKNRELVNRILDEEGIA